MTWDGAPAEWWAAEVETDPAYRRDVDPLLNELLPENAGRVLDLGCGTGRLVVPGTIGVDASLDLLAAAEGGVVAADIRRLPFAAGSFDGAYSVLVLEHVADPGAVLTEAARVVKPGGFFALVINHPLFTAPGSGPFLDDDGEVLWRFGDYLNPGGHSDEPAGPASVRFHHHPIGVLLGAGAAAGWVLKQFEERSTGERQDPLLAAQGSLPRLLGVRWRLA